MDVLTHINRVDLKRLTAYFKLYPNGRDKKVRPKARLIVA